MSEGWERWTVKALLSGLLIHPRCVEGNRIVTIGLACAVNRSTIRHIAVASSKGWLWLAALRQECAFRQESFFLMQGVDGSRPNASVFETEFGSAVMKSAEVQQQHQWPSFAQKM